MKIEIKGKIVKIYETQTFDSGFCKREFVVEIPGEYPNPVPVEAVKDKCEILDKFQEGQEVEVSGYLNGNYWEKGDRYFLSLRLAFVKEVEGGTPAPAPAQDEPADTPF